MDELRRRTQGKGEDISWYLTNIRYIVSCFKRPPSERTLTRLVFGNLLPEYGDFMADKRVSNLESIESYGRKFEKREERKKRYVAPLTVADSRIPEVAFVKGSQNKRNSSTAGTEEVSAVNDIPKMDKNANANGKNNSNPNNKKGNNNKKTQGAFNCQNSQNGQQGEKKPDRQESQQSYSDVSQGIINRQSTINDTCKSGVQKQSSEMEFHGACYNCNVVGHRSSNCPRPKSKPEFNGNCFKCGLEGHSISYCPDVDCSTCNQPGNTSKVCPTSE